MIAEIVDRRLLSLRRISVEGVLDTRKVQPKNGTRCTSSTYSWEKFLEYDGVVRRAVVKCAEWSVVQ